MTRLELSVSRDSAGAESRELVVSSDSSCHVTRLELSPCHVTRLELVVSSDSAGAHSVLRDSAGALLVM